MSFPTRWLTWAAVLICFLCLPWGACGQAEIEGIYKFIEDQPAHMSAAKGAEILLSVALQGTMSITATKPGEVMTTQGTYQVRGDRISLDFPELGKSVKDGRFSLDNDILILPLQFIGDGEGTSKWRRMESGRGSIQRFFAVLNKEFESRTPAAEAVKRAAEEAKRLSAENPEGEKALRIQGYSLWAGGAGCTLEFEDGHQEAVLAATASAESPEPQKQVIGPLATDPRTHIPAQPHTAPDDPKNKTAILFAPFDNTPFYAMDWSVVMGVPSPGFVARVTSHKDAGEDLSYLEKKLRSRHYEVITLRDEEATPLALHEAILKNLPAPGVIYMSTHGGATIDHKTVLLATGVCLGLVTQENDVHKSSQRVQEILHRTVPAGYYGPETETRLAVEAKPVLSMWMQKARNLPVSYLMIRNIFFDRVRKEGADFSTSFIYANACFTVNNTALVTSCGARMLLGNKIESNVQAAITQARWIFTRLAKRTFSLREVLGLMRQVVQKRVEMFPEDGWLARVGVGDDEKLGLYGADGQECEIPTFDVLYLCWMARWDSKDPEAGSQALEDTYHEFWSKQSFSRLKSPFANAGVRGTHVPAAEEVKFARHLVSGVPTLPGGRFTLNDTDPGQAK
ncbi:MAG: hypothetical protein WCB96_09835 [Candidatus Aminicenantales bacterium]